MTTLVSGTELFGRARARFSRSWRQVAASTSTIPPSVISWRPPSELRTANKASSFLSRIDRSPVPSPDPARLYFPCDFVRIRDAVHLSTDEGAVSWALADIVRRAGRGSAIALLVTLPCRQRD